MRGNFTVFSIADIHGIKVKRRQGTHHPNHNRHRVGIPPKAAKNIAKLIVQHGAAVDGVGELLFLLGIGQFTVQQQIRHFHEVAMFGQLFNGVAAVVKQAFFPINKGDVRVAGRR